MAWFLAGGTWYYFYGEKADGRIFPFPAKNLNNLIGCSTEDVDAALRANASYFRYGMRSAGNKPASAHVFYLGEDKYELNTNRPLHGPAQIQNWNHGSEFGENGRYQACALHIYMCASGIPPTVEGTLQALSRLAGGAVAFAKNDYEKKKIEREMTAGNLAAGKAAPVFTDSTAVMPIVDEAVMKGVHYNEDVLKTYAENAKRAAQAIRSGEIEFPVLRGDGSYYVPQILEKILRARGIEPYEMPFDELSGIGICYGYNKYLKKSGIKFQTSKGEDFKYAARGLVFLQDTAKDDDGHTFLAIQIRNTDWNYTLISKEDEKLKNFRRFMNVGPAAPVGADKSVETARDLPVMILEGAFDKYSVSNVAKGMIATIATQGAKNHRYILEKADKYREQGRVVILAYDDDEAGVKANQELKKGFEEKGVMVFRGCGCLGSKDFNELLQRNREDAASLASVLAKTARLFKAGYWTVEAANAFTGGYLRSGVKFGSGGTEVSQSTCAEFVMGQVRRYCQNGGRIQDVDKALDDVFLRLALPDKGIQPRQERSADVIDIQARNADIFRTAAQNGDILIGALNNHDFMAAYWQKGVYVEKLPVDIMRKLGFSGQRGVYPISSRTFEQSRRPIFGTIMKYDSLNGSNSYAISEMVRVPDNNNKLTYTHEGGKSYILGKAGTFGLEHAAALRKVPVIFTESIYDALRIMSVSHGKVAAVSVDKSIKRLPEEYIEKIKERDNIALLAVNSQRPESIEHFNELGAQLAEKGCSFLYWPNCPGFGTIKELQAHDREQGYNGVPGRKLEMLTAAIAKLSAMADTGRFTSANTQAFVKSITNNRVIANYADASQAAYASSILVEMQKEMEFHAAQARSAEETAGVVQAVLEKSIKLFNLALGQVENEKRMQAEKQRGENQKMQYTAGQAYPEVQTQSAQGAAQPGRSQQTLQMPETELQGMVYSVGPDCTFTGTAVNYIGTDTNGIPYNSGTSALRKTAKMANSASLAETYSRNTQDARVLEVSSKSTETLGIKLSAMNLNINISIPKGNDWQLTLMKVETLYQASKVFKDSGDHPEWYSLNGWEAKKAAAALHKKEQLVGFRLNGENYSLADGSMFYNWIYARAMCSIKNLELVKELKEGGWNAFTDIESKRGQYACQAEALAIYTALARSGKLGEAMKNMNTFKTAVNSLRRGNCNMISREQAQTLTL